MRRTRTADGAYAVHTAHRWFPWQLSLSRFFLKLPVGAADIPPVSSGSVHLEFWLLFLHFADTLLWHGANDELVLVQYAVQSGGS